MNIVNYNLFPTIVTEIQCDLFNYIQSDLISWIYEYQKTTETVVHSNRGGWQSPANFHKDETFEIFKNYILKNANDALQHYKCNFNLTNMWININKKGDYNTCHDHPGATMAGVFWVKIPKNGSKLVFRSPHSFSEHPLLKNIDDEIAKTYNYCDEFKFKPTEGSMVLFASHLLHYVDSNESDEDRISIAFNLIIV